MSVSPQPSLLNDLDRLRLENQCVGGHHGPVHARLPRHRPGERFLKGPIPWSWLARAGRLPGRALHIALMIWYLAGLKRSATVTLSLSGMKTEFGVRRDSARRGLQALENAGLIAVERRPGRRPLVTILPLAEAVSHKVDK